MNKYLSIAANRVGNLGLNYAGKILPFPKAKIVSGAGSRREIPRLLKKLGINKVLLVTDLNVEALHVPEIIENIIANGIQVEVYDKVKPNPTSDIVYEIRDLYKSKKCNGFLVVGGGSPMDAAKAAASLVALPKKVQVKHIKGLCRVVHKLPPLLAVPTTSGTGSETTMAAVITDSETRHKGAVMSPRLIPTDTVLDPELLATLPPLLTATTGMDALTHAVESFLCWTNYTPETVLFAEEATALIFKYLERAYNNPNDLEARTKMLEASYLAGWSFGRAGVGYVHAIAHTFGGLYDVGHGMANAVILPIVLEEYGSKIYDKLAHLAVVSGVKESGSIAEMAEAFINEIYSMNERMGIPKGLEVKDSDIPQMVKWATAEAHPTYPVPVIFDKNRLTKVIKTIQSRA